MAHALFVSSREHQIAELADELDCSYGEAERALIKKEAQARRSSKMTKPRIKKMSYKTVIKRAIEAGHDYIADNPEGSIEDAAYDIADCLLYDPRIYASVKRHLKEFHNNVDRWQMKEILADYVAEGACK